MNSPNPMSRRSSTKGIGWTGKNLNPDELADNPVFGTGELGGITHFTAPAGSVGAGMVRRSTTKGTNPWSGPNLSSAEYGGEPGGDAYGEDIYGGEKHFENLKNVP